MLTATLALVGGLALADGSRHGPGHGPPVAGISAKLGLDATQQAAIEKIFADAHERMETARRQSMQQVDTELATVLTADQLAEFKKLMSERRGHFRGPPPQPPASTN
jgi:Spy/CpxP family protein refolding chaperone